LYLDTNQNGTQDATEPDLANVDVIVTDNIGATTTVQTNANGDYLATNIRAGNASVNIDSSDPDFPTGAIQTEGTNPTAVVINANVVNTEENNGFFVPASAMKFSLFESIFTRIVSKDNLAKGLSTFAVEMLEMKNIFNRAGTKSLILGDEISHGTETLSGVSIVASAIMKLAKLRSLFLFATHLHQLSTMDEVVKLKNVVNLHLEVAYDEHKDKLLYNRTLQSGSGSSIYGLEFAKSLHMDDEFLEMANKIRKRLANDYDELELLVKKKKRSKYNRDLYVTKCVICGNIAEDVHHISHQSMANQAGFIGHFHQDHKHNLIPLCKDHHNEIHSGKIKVKGFLMTSTGLELEYEEQLKNR